MVKEKAGPDCDVEVPASSGWFKWFKNHHLLHDVKVSGEFVSADAEEAEEVLKTLYKRIMEENYLPEQILSVGESSWFWKWMPERTSFHMGAKSVPGFGAFMDKISVLLEGSVPGYKFQATNCETLCDLAQQEPQGLQAYR